MSNQSSRILQIEDIHTYYGTRYILQGVNLEIAPGEVVSLVGRNGAGKSTLLKSVIGLKKPKRGRVLYLGQDITQLSPYAIAHLGIGLVPQGGGVFPDISVKENLLFSPVRRPGDWTEERIFQLFPRLAERQQNRGRTLSGGEQKMLAMGRALMMNPKLLLMDEPSEGLAPLFVQEVGRMIGEISRAGVSVLLVEQNSSSAFSAGTRCYVFNKGRAVYNATPAELRADRKIMQQYLGV